MTREGGGGFYPVVLCLRDRRVLVVGGGKVGARKAAGLVEAGAHVVAVSPRFAPAYARLVDTAALTLIERRYVSEDLAGMALVVAATDDREVNAQVSADAHRTRVLVSVVDDPRTSDFIVPAIVRRGDRARRAMQSAGTSARGSSSPSRPGAAVPRWQAISGGSSICSCPRTGKGSCGSSASRMRGFRGRSRIPRAVRN